MNEAVFGATNETKLIRVDEPTLYAHWPWLEKKLARIKKKERPDESWTPAHVREAILRGLRGQAPVELFFSLEADGEAQIVSGFMVTVVKSDPYSGLPLSLLVWFLYANDALLKRFLPALEEMARRRYLPAIEFRSTRTGWMKLAFAAGFSAHEVTYRKDVN